MDIIEAIESRRSVRTYDATAVLSAGQLAAVEKAVRDSVSPFGGRVVVKIVDFNPGEKFRPSTYGVISGARRFIVMGYGEDESSRLSAGFIGEQIVLAATEAGLGTCWIGGTFKGSAFAELAAMPDETPLKIVIPFGIAASRTRLLDKIMRKTVGSDHRRPVEKMFFSDDFTKPVSGDSKFAEALRLMRLAPSACNSQPWRALVVCNRVDFYCKVARELSLVDMGIGFCHFKIGCDRQGIKGVFKKIDDPMAAPDNILYVTSFNS